MPPPNATLPPSSAKTPRARSRKKKRPKPFLYPQFCKACSRCIAACPKDCIHISDEIDPRTGLTPVWVDLEACNGCGICFEACPEPFGLMPKPDPDFDPGLVPPETYFGPKASTAPTPTAIPDERVALPRMEPMVLKGTHAAAIGALLAGCRHFFGYPITPSTEGAELLADLLPKLDGAFVQAVSEVATVNMMYGCGGAGLRTMTFTSSPGFSLMLEGISYMIGAEVPGVFVNVMRGGPGLGNIAPEQADIKLVCRGLGHGNTHAIVLAPSSPQEMLDLTMLAFDLTFQYRNPVVVAGDGYLGQITGKVTLPDEMVRPGLPAWAVYGDEMHRGNLICSIDLSEQDLERHNAHLNDKYRRMTANEQRADHYRTDDADWIVVAANTPSRMAKGAVRALREAGIKVGLFRPVTLWPFPVDALLPLVERARGIVVVEAGSGQLEDELRLALSHRTDRVPRIEHIQHFGGVLPQQHEIVEHILALEEQPHGS
ncbi:MAG: 3-methyl-2-oxobutanoate dehydrogenase subunit VorB [Bacteroidetes bacterium]|jgi:pyruvate/2-oxoacid:ferredoxin oxidoreductase alpha subunit/NAD-dependent dihydropyrimidine dehydrogenase PreA subunit|nr:3-methyl-2-oxobutanoate dehydrogenase subunit VorB [Bacteroidota bacterium]